MAVTVAKSWLLVLACSLAILSAYTNAVWPRMNYIHRMLQVRHKALKVNSFNWKDCGDASNPGHLKTFTLSPDPLKLPGNISVGFDAILNVPLPSPLTLDLSVEKKVVFWITIPCIDDFGSCNYQDVCPLIAKLDCPEIFQKYGLPCKCPIAPGHYSLPASKFYVDDSFLPSVLTDGEYKVTAKLSQNKRNIGCAFFDFSIGR